MRQQNSSINFYQGLITGATSGLGQGLAHFLAEKQIPLILTGKNRERLQLLETDLAKKVSLVTIAIDLAIPENRKALLDLISAKKPNLVINNAGFGLYGNSMDLPLQEQLQMIEVNISALVEISLHAAKTMHKNGIQGTILNVSSAASFFPFPFFNVYAASKSFVNSFSLALDAEMQPAGIRVLCACPGQIATNFRMRASKGYPQKEDHRTMSMENAVSHLWDQIQKQKRLYIFDTRYHLGVWLFQLLPDKLRALILERNIRTRIEQFYIKRKVY